MSRNGSGTYTLPSGNPVVSGTLIESSWANTTLSDLASAMTDSLSRSAQGGMTAALRLYDGTSSVPGLAWGSETTTGWYRAGAGDMRLVVTGSEVVKYLSSGVTVTGTLGVSGVATLTANPVLSAGTANGVAYLNGSKVLTSGSALTFDGTKLGIGSAPATTSGRSVDLDGVTLQPLFTMRASSLTSATATWTLDTSNTLITFDGSANWPFCWVLAGSEQMRLTSTGLGIGTSAPVGRTDAVANGYSAYVARSASSGSNVTAMALRVVDAPASYFANAQYEALSHQWLTQGAERARIDSSGNLLVGQTTAGAANLIGTSIENSGLNNARITVNHSTSGSSNGSFYMQFAYGGTVAGTISQSSTTTVAYNTSSDYRLKENIAPMTGALATVAQLKPCTYTWKTDGSDGQGFIAHELQAIVPDCVTGEKDAVDADGNPQYQGIDTSFLVATLTAAIQEQQALIASQSELITALTARVTALETN